MTQQTRRVVGNITLSLDGRITGRGGDYDMGWIVPHAVTDIARDHMTLMTGGATTVLLGRKNYEGFGSYWPSVANDDNAEPRDRAFAQWLDTVEKVVFSTTLTDAPWQNSRVSRDPISEVDELRTRPGGDIIVLSSSSIIRALLAANELDRLIINLCPEIVCGGARLFDDTLPQSAWSLADQSTSTTGATLLTYDHQR
ncbi:MAG: dihydrofolate reductase family protein [Ilumatobacteraceae bacterium]